MEDPLREVITSVSDAVDDIVDNTQTGLDTISVTDLGMFTILRKKIQTATVFMSELNLEEV